MTVVCLSIKSKYSFRPKASCLASLKLEPTKLVVSMHSFTKGQGTCMQEFTFLCESVYARLGFHISCLHTIKDLYHIIYRFIFILNQSNINRMTLEDFCKFYFDLDICCLCPGFLDGGSSCQWNTSSYEGRWVSGTTAGGCMNNRGTYNKDTTDQLYQQLKTDFVCIEQK